MASAKRLLQGVGFLVGTTVFSLGFVLLTPCELTLAEDTRRGLWFFERCSFGTTFLGIAASLVGGLVGLVVGRAAIGGFLPG